jgi:hypothetical protein
MAVISIPVLKAGRSFTALHEALELDERDSSPDDPLMWRRVVADANDPEKGVIVSQWERGDLSPSELVDRERKRLIEATEKIGVRLELEEPNVYVNPGFHGES